MNRSPVTILGIPVDSFSMEETVQYVFQLMGSYDEDRRPRLVCTVNLDFVANTLSWSLRKSRHPELLSVLRSADLVTADGMPLVWTSRMLGRPLQERVTGADLVPLLCQKCAEQGKSVFFLGGRGDSAREASMVLRERYPGLAVAGCDSPSVHVEGSGLASAYGDDGEIVDRINASKADILFVGFGNPKQEIWFARNRHRLKVPVSIGIGGTFDFITGAIARAPEWMRRSGMEWLFRITQDPFRLLKRYLIDFAKCGIMIWPSVLIYQYMKKTAPLAYLRRCKNGFFYKYMPGGVLSVILPGIIDSSTVPRLAGLVPKRPTSHMVLDLSDVALVDSSGLSLLFQIINSWESRGFEIILAGMSPQVERFLLYNRMHDVTATRHFRTVEEALSFLQNRADGRNPRVEFSDEDGLSRILLSGKLNPSSISERDVRQIASGVNNESCVIDLKGLGSINTSGITFLLMLRQAVVNQGRTCTITGETGEVAQMLKITGARSLF